MFFAFPLRATTTINHYSDLHLTDRDPHTRARALQLFAAAMHSQDTKKLKKIVQFLYDPSSIVKQEAVNLLNHIRPVDSIIHQQIMQAMDDSDPEVRIAANWIADSNLIQDPNVIQILLKSLEHPHPEVRRSAAHALGSMQSKNKTVRTKLALASQDPSAIVQVAARWAIKKMDSPCKRLF